MYIKRLIEKTIIDTLKTFPVVILTGARQSGKTTLLKHLFSSTFNYISLDELDIRSLAINDPREFLNKFKTPLIIDKIQNAPQLLPYIKAVVDKERKNGRFIITGSQQFPLMKNVSESLAGRAAILNLYPFMIEEITGNYITEEKSIDSYLKNASNKKIPGSLKIDLGSWLLDGGYPGLFVNSKISKNIWFSSYIQTYIDRDVRGNIKNENLNDFERFLKLMASRTSQELSYSNLSRDIGLSVPTIKSWISLLQTNSIIYLLQPYYKNFGKRIIKSPKLYFLDTGLAAYLSGIQTKEHLLNGPMGGALFETFVVTNFLKRFSALDINPSLYYWKNISGIEVDLLVEHGNKLIPIEIKLASTIYNNHYKSLMKWIYYSKLDIELALLITSSPVAGKIAKNVYNCNWYNI
ncbi:MAG: ATP-binding protein [Actinobacteria bacterium]|nr:ATP-binding protein [Actinomycetota bacterium]